MAGGGIKGGVIHGATDELGFHAVENRHYVTDIHATVLHQLGLDPRRLEVPVKSGWRLTLARRHRNHGVTSQPLAGECILHFVKAARRVLWDKADSNHFSDRWLAWRR